MTSKITSLKIFIRFYKYAKPYWVSLFVVLLISLLIIAINIINPLLLKVLIDDALMEKDKALLLKLIILMIVLGIVSSGFGFISTYFNGIVTGKIMIDIRKDIFNHLLYLPQNYFKKNKVGDIVQKVNNEVDNIRNFITNSLLRIIKDLIMIISYSSALIWLNANLFLFTGITFPLALLALRYFQPKIKKILSNIRKKDSEILGFFIEEFQNIKLIQAFNIYANENSKLGIKLTDRYNLGIKRIKLMALNSSFMGLIFSLTMTILFSYGGMLIINDILTIGALLAFINYLINLSTPVRDLQNLYMEIIRVSVSMERINDILNTSTILELDSIEQFKHEESIHFRNVSLEYDKNLVLNNLNLTLEKGKCYAITGSSGSGKSTIINLLLRFIEPTKGCIYSDRVPFNTIDIFKLRDSICYISQEASLFNDTIKNNINVGNLNASSKEIEYASKKVDLSKLTIHDVEEANSRIGDQGTKISGGEKQRIALARAFIRKAEIIILDEAFASLDSESEREILNSIRLEHSTSTVIIISHRASTLKEVDEVVFLHKGAIAEIGKPDELLLKKGYYWDLFKEQLEYA